MFRAATHTRGLGPALGALLALALSLRVVGAALLAPGVAGFLPICTGTEIAWVAVDADGQAVPETAPTSEPCTLFGLVLAAAPEGPALRPRPAPLHAAPETPPRPAPRAQTPPAYRPRGPPPLA
ncbi:hypothetical protein [Albimonas pacifica]|uniref:Uncharacterized protein n=1 Tax=Albimonas pacifica TaxID=1114924 RepID=A0A1I3EDM8_9RHOB|nr:hypothetical protein [Albimonas pacifica]SFH97064.1 hypothetical protein SAMN05216258_103316 [Albimonas pacifica]